MYQIHIQSLQRILAKAERLARQGNEEATVRALELAEGGCQEVVRRIRMPIVDSTAEETLECPHGFTWEACPNAECQAEVETRPIRPAYSGQDDIPTPGGRCEDDRVVEIRVYGQDVGYGGEL